MRTIPASQFQNGLDRNLGKTLKALFKQVDFGRDVPKGEGYFIIFWVIV
jgi:hypothetical protein